MRTHIIINGILLTILLLLLALIYPVKELKRLNEKNYYVYNEQVTLLEDTPTKNDGTIISGTVMNAELLITGNNLLHANGRTDEGKHISVTLPIDSFQEHDKLYNDLAKLKEDKQHQINKNITLMIVLAVTALLVSGIIIAVTIKKHFHKNKYTAIYLAGAIFLIAAYYIAILFFIR